VPFDVLLSPAVSGIRGFLSYGQTQSRAN
jgi:hypothetical protein